MSKIVRLGDRSDHNGTMVSANSTFKCNGVTVCVDQDSHSCPIIGHGVTAVSGQASFKSNDKRVIKTGDRAGCGAIMITGSENSFT